MTAGTRLVITLGATVVLTLVASVVGAATGPDERSPQPPRTSAVAEAVESPTTSAPRADGTDAATCLDELEGFATKDLADPVAMAIGSKGAVRLQIEPRFRPDAQPDSGCSRSTWFVCGKDATDEPYFIERSSIGLAADVVMVEQRKWMIGDLEWCEEVVATTPAPLDIPELPDLPDLPDPTDGITDRPEERSGDGPGVPRVPNTSEPRAVTA